MREGNTDGDVWPGPVGVCVILAGDFREHTYDYPTIRLTASVHPRPLMIGSGRRAQPRVSPPPLHADRLASRLRRRGHSLVSTTTCPVVKSQLCAASNAKMTPNPP